jgi:hypothetical protein
LLLRGDFVQSKMLVIVSVLVAAATGLSYTWYATRSGGPQPWSSSGLAAKYVSAELRQVDSQNASLFLYYELENKTDSDYRLGGAPGFPVMSRLKAGGSLSSQEDVRLSNATFLPARQRARVALELRHNFGWPADNDPALQDDLREFVNQRLSAVDEFVLFDQPDRVQIEFPRGWQELQLASAASQ